MKANIEMQIGGPRNEDITGSIDLPGIPLRDLFAMAALNSIAGEPPLTTAPMPDHLGTFIDYERAGQLAYRYADAMLKARREGDGR